LNNHGALYVLMGNPEEAEPYLKRALTIEQDALGGDHPAVAGIMLNYAAVLRQMRRKGEAKEMEKRAKAILARNQSPNYMGYTVNLSDLQAKNARP
jgi:Flp pilus assembly protein TadD